MKINYSDYGPVRYIGSFDPYFKGFGKTTGKKRFVLRKSDCDMVAYLEECDNEYPQEDGSWFYKTIWTGGWFTFSPEDFYQMLVEARKHIPKGSVLYVEVPDSWERDWEKDMWIKKWMCDTPYQEMEPEEEKAQKIEEMLDEIDEERYYKLGRV